jgi:hypothetical protein
LFGAACCCLCSYPVEPTEEGSEEQRGKDDDTDDPQARPNPPITEEGLGFWVTPPGTWVEGTPWDGRRGAITACVGRWRTLPVVSRPGCRHCGRSLEKGGRPIRSSVRRFDAGRFK